MLFAIHEGLHAVVELRVHLFIVDDVEGVLGVPPEAFDGKIEPLGETVRACMAARTRLYSCSPARNAVARLPLSNADEKARGRQVDLADAYLPPGGSRGGILGTR